jgi:hypothetical protein
MVAGFMYISMSLYQFLQSLVDFLETMYKHGPG